MATTYPPSEASGLLRPLRPSPWPIPVSRPLAPPPQAGECLCRGARVLEDTDPDTAIKLYYDSLDVYESSEKDAYRWSGLQA